MSVIGRLPLVRLVIELGSNGQLIRSFIDAAVVQEPDVKRVKVAS
jgi:hypothetical protein